MGAYCASKFAVMGLVESLAKEVGAHGVRVNCVNPGPVEGGLARAMIRETAETQGKSEQDSYDELTAPIALGRLVEPSEVADAVVFLASPLARLRDGPAARRRRRHAREVAPSRSHRSSCEQPVCKGSCERARIDRKLQIAALTPAAMFDQTGTWCWSRPHTSRLCRRLHACSRSRPSSGSERVAARRPPACSSRS